MEDVNTKNKAVSSNVDDETISTLDVANVNYILVATEDDSKFVFSSSAVFRKGFRVDPLAVKILLKDDKIMVENEDDSLDMLLEVESSDAPTVIKDQSHTYLSPRGHHLLYRGIDADKPVITVENTGKWHDLFLVDIDGTVSSLDNGVNGFDDWRDHCPRPDLLMEYAIKHGFYVDEQSFETMLGRIYIEHDYTIDNSIVFENIISAN